MGKEPLEEKEMQLSTTHQSAMKQPVRKDRDTPQGNVLLLLYDGAIRFVKLAQDQIKAGNKSAKEVSLSKAYAIIAEFINSLDRDRAPDLCENLTQIYEFMLSKLTEANANMDPEPLDIVLGYLTDMRQTWSEAVDQTTA
jgi:flagellar secretion chaperone FliS